MIAVSGVNVSNVFLQPEGVPTKRIYQTERGGEESFSGLWTSVGFT